MRFLLTNDDGIDAKGLALLAEVSAQHGEVTVLAPLAEQSGVGHRVNTRGCLALEDRGNARYALAGTPADCTRVGMMGLKLEVDWVLSGLNHGGNLGVDIPMSGTVAAAREGAILGRQAIAISQIISMKYPPDRERIKRLTARVIAELVYCPPDPSPHDVRYLQSEEGYTYAGVFLDRPRKAGCDVDVAFQGKVTISVLSVV